MGFNAQNWINVLLFLFSMGMLILLYCRWMSRHQDKHEERRDSHKRQA